MTIAIRPITPTPWLAKAARRGAGNARFHVSPWLACLVTCFFCLLFPLPSNCNSVAPISIMVMGMDGNPVLVTSEVTRVETKDRCEYRLEFKDPKTIAWPIGEVSGNRGNAQRIQILSCPPQPATPPAFDSTPESSAPRFEEQTAYYWTKKARDYAEQHFWITPPKWEGKPPKFAKAQLSPAVLSQTSFDALALDGFSTACFPRDPDACMRAWQVQNPRVYIKAGKVDPRTVVHEYGHYAAGFIFGHMDPLRPNGMDIARCVHRSFQEGIANSFQRLFVHYELAVANPGGKLSVRDLKSQWTNVCLETDEYLMSNPLWEAFEQALWGMGKDGLGQPLDIPWSSPSEANETLANAFTYALATHHDFRTHRIAYAALDYIDKTELSADIKNGVRAIFASHGLAPTANKVKCSENDECVSGYCDRGDGTSKTSLCMPAANTGVVSDPCSNDNQCASRYCANLTADAQGHWLPGQCAAKAELGEWCSNNGNCASTYCDAGANTAKTNLCMPRGGTGQINEPCSHNTQCGTGYCANLFRRPDSSWIPGQCSVPGVLGQSCSSNAQCSSGYCDSGSNTAGTNQCMPRGGTGKINDPCTHNTQCGSGFCANLVRASDGNWIPGKCSVPGSLGLSCSNNAECSSGYCDSGFNTANTNLCMPRGGTGASGDPCTNGRQCSSGRCNNLTRNTSGGWDPGQCN